MKPIPRSAVVLSIVVVAAAAAVSLATLLWAGSFPDPSAVAWALGIVFAIAFFRARLP